MDLYTIDVRRYRNIFWQTLIPKLVVAVASFFMVTNGIYLLEGFDPGKKLTLPVLILLVILATFHSQYQRKRLAKLQEITDFDQRVEEYEKFYQFRLLWYLFSCLVSCGLSLLTGRYLFLGFAALDILISLPLFPSLQLFKRELKNEEIIFLS